MKKFAKDLSPEVVLFYILPLIFISTYVYLYRQPSHIILAHLYVVSLLILATIALKVVVVNLIKHRVLSLFIAANIYAPVLVVFLLYYLLVIVGMQSWGRVITEEFIFSYAKQAREFCKVLGISYTLAVAALVLFYMLLVAFCYFFLRRVSWHQMPPPVSPLIFNTLFVSLFIFSAYWLIEYANIDSSHNGEPVTLTLFSGKPKKQNHTANLGNKANQRINELENNARKNYAVNPEAKRKNLIVIIVDGLRPDHTSVYGYARDTTPYLRKLEERGIATKFNNVRSTCGETTCAHASFFASRFPHRLPDNMFSLQEVLKRYNYTTNFIISGDHVNFHNIREVYGDVDNYFDGSMQDKFFFNDDKLIIEKTKSLPEWNGKPQMIHYHVLSGHTVGSKFDEFLKYSPYKNYAGLRNGGPQVEYTNFYDNGVHQADFVVKTLLDTLKAKKYLEDALVVITSDHGESLGEHQLLLHTNSVREELLRIPLIIIPYGYKSQTSAQRDQFMSLVDLAPTILHEFDMPVPDTWAGRAIQQNQVAPLSFFQMGQFDGFYDLSDPENLWKYWLDEYSLEEFAFNISKDPGEHNNVFMAQSNAQKEKWRKIKLSKKSL